MSLDRLQDIEMKRKAIVGGLEKVQMDTLLDENSALNRLEEHNVDLHKYIDEKITDEVKQSEKNMLTDKGERKHWSVSEISSIGDRTYASRTMIRTAIDRGLGQTITLTDIKPFI